MYPRNLDNETKQELIEYLYEFITPERRERIEKTLSYRTRHLTIVLEDLHYAQNSNAVLRNCECFGVQDYYLIENYHRFRKHAGVTLGAVYWTDLFRYKLPEENNSQLCFDDLREKGYKIVVTTLENAQSPESIPLDEKLAFVFGNEDQGISETAVKNADIFMKLPMYGFTQSFNISVSAALTCSHFIERLHQSQVDWQLSPQEKLDLHLAWVRQSLRSRQMGEKLEENFFSSQKRGIIKKNKLTP